MKSIPSISFAAIVNLHYVNFLQHHIRLNYISFLQLSVNYLFHMQSYNLLLRDYNIIIHVT